MPERKTSNARKGCPKLSQGPPPSHIQTQPIDKIIGCSLQPDGKTAFLRTMFTYAIKQGKGEMVLN